MKSYILLIETSICVALCFVLAACGNNADVSAASTAPPATAVEHEENGGTITVDHPEKFPLVKAGELLAGQEVGNRLCARSGTQGRDRVAGAGRQRQRLRRREVGHGKLGLQVFCLAAGAVGRAAPPQGEENVLRTLPSPWVLADLDGDSQIDVVTSRAQRLPEREYSHEVSLKLSGSPSTSFTFRDRYPSVELNFRDEVEVLAESVLFAQDVRNPAIVAHLRN